MNTKIRARRGESFPDPEIPATESQLAWFCIRAQPKHEHIAAEHLRQLEDVEVFLPRVRFRRTTRQGVAWVTEALFPNYLFARFDWKLSLRQVHYAPGVSGIVHFGMQWPTVPGEVIAELQQTFGSTQIHELSAPPAVGETVRIAGGILHGLRAVITQTMPGRERVRVLLDFLGRQTAVEIRLNAVVREADGRGLIS